jgi:hypothetical protein
MIFVELAVLRLSQLWDLLRNSRWATSASSGAAVGIAAIYSDSRISLGGQPLTATLSRCLWWARSRCTS